MATAANRAFVLKRREAIVALLKAANSMSVSTLAERMGTSPLTIRRDLDALAEAGLVERRYGKAVIAGEATEEAQRSALVSARCEAIARAAANLVQDHHLLFVNTSSTALMTLRHIHAQGVTVVTNSARADGLPCPPGGMVLMTGGEVRPPRSVLSGEFALANVRSVSASLCFVGCAGISLTAGVTSTTQQEATVNSLMVERSDRVVLLADSSKLGIGAGFSYAPLNRVSLLITDSGAVDEDVQILLEAGVGEILRVDA